MKLRTREDTRLAVAANVLIHLLEEEAIGWETDDPMEDDDEVNLDLVVMRWFGKSIGEAYRDLKDAAR